MAYAVIDFAEDTEIELAQPNTTAQVSDLIFSQYIVAFEAGVLARRNGVLVLMSIELILNAVNINLVAMGAFTGNIAGEVFALFVIAIAAAEVGVGLAIVLLIYRNRKSIDLSQVDLVP